MRIIPVDQFAAAAPLGVGVVGQAAAWRIAVWSGLLILVVLIAAGVLWALRRRMLDRPGSDRGPLTLHDVRQMRDRGEIDENEYETLRRATLAEWGVGGGSSPDADTPRTRDADTDG